MKTTINTTIEELTSVGAASRTLVARSIDFLRPELQYSGLRKRTASIIDDPPSSHKKADSLSA
jgi:hypothetical protein